jgi:hypothetical protein
MNSKMKLIFALLLIGLSAHAEEWGLTAGVAQTYALSRVPNTTTADRTSFRGGLTSSFFFLDNLKIRTGILYTQRRFEIHEGEDSYTYDWKFIDIPGLLQYRYSDHIGLFAGFILALTIADRITPGLEFTGTRKIAGLYQGGVSFLFDNMYGFDLYFERGFDNLDDNAAQPSGFGINLNYYFL